MRSIFCASFAAVSFALLPGIAQSADVLTTADPDVVLDIAKGFGSATLEKDANGDPKVVGRLQGLKYFIYFYGCKEGLNCRSIQLFAGYTDPFTVEKANEWNAKYRWLTSYSDNGSNFEMDVDFAGGVTREHVEAQFSTWDSFIDDIKEFVK